MTPAKARALAPYTPSFTRALGERGPLRRAAVTTLQINVGKRCNQACHHCHVEAGPRRTEMMTAATAARILEVLEATPSIHTVDITGGAPELNPNFRDLVIRSRELGKRVIDRCNLTVLFEPGQEELADFLAGHGVAVTASLPCYTADNVEAQRGRGVFDKSIEALRLLNRLGYGDPDTGLELDLVYNPVGAFLPPPQAGLEADYKRELGEAFGVRFNRLLTITNMPISRFAHMLARDGKHDEYMSLLVNHFNPETIDGLMCRQLVSVGYDGTLYDCDFNQMLELEIGGLGPGVRTIDDVASLSDLDGAPIAVDSHCFGCTAGAGSSCGGALE
jgi:radical SAM/Cys-rich protein